MQDGEAAPDRHRPSFSGAAFQVRDRDGDPAPQGRFSSVPVKEVHFGPGSVRHATQALRTLPEPRLVMIASGSLGRSEKQLDRVRSHLGDCCVGVFCDLEPHVPRRVVLKAAAFARENRATALLSFGGSSAHDTAKAVCWALAADIRRPEEFDRYAVRFDYPHRRIVPSMPGTPIPLLAIPTTLSASEFTNIIGITDEARRHKDIYQDDGVAFRSVFLDPELTLSTPEWLWLSSGVKALDHCVEALLSSSAQPMTDALALHALAMLVEALPAVKRNPGDVAARGRAQVAAWLSVSGLGNVSLGLSHGIGHQLGAIAGVPHGYTSCVILPHVLGFNRPATAARQAFLAARIGLEAAGGDEQQAAALQATILKLIRDDLGLPWRLRDVGVQRGDLERIAKASIADPLVATNPRHIESFEEVARLLDQAW